MQTRPPYIAPPPVKPPKMYSQNTVSTLVVLLIVATLIIVMFCMARPTIVPETIDWLGSFFNSFIHGK